MTDRPDGAPEAASDTPEGAATGDPLNADAGIEGQTEGTQATAATWPVRHHRKARHATDERQDRRWCSGSRQWHGCRGSRRCQREPLRPRARRAGAEEHLHPLLHGRRPRPRSPRASLIRRRGSSSSVRSQCSRLSSCSVSSVARTASSPSRPRRARQQKRVRRPVPPRVLRRVRRPRPRPRPRRPHRLGRRRRPRRLPRRHRPRHRPQAQPARRRRRLPDSVT